MQELFIGISPSVAIGLNAVANNENTLSIGNDNIASGAYSIAIGAGNRTTGWGPYGMGNHTTGMDPWLFGVNTKAMGLHPHRFRVKQ
ncbi:MAG: hypothetical protein IPH46_09570 [Bacteroidetes bacterium]|nr:hypothetical protein [Bacteroidota bacterium]